MLGNLTGWHLIIILAIILLLFGGNRFSAMMGDVAKGLKSFKQGMSEEDEIKARNPDQRAADQRQIPPQQPPIDVTPQPRAADPATPPPPPPARDDGAL